MKLNLGDVTDFNLFFFAFGIRKKNVFFIHLQKWKLSHTHYSKNIIFVLKINSDMTYN